MWKLMTNIKWENTSKVQSPTQGWPKIVWDLWREFYRNLFTSKYHLNIIYLFLFNFKSIINSYLFIWLIQPKWTNDNYYIGFTIWHITNKRKAIQIFILLYYLSNIDDIPITSVYKFFLLKFVLALAFFIQLMVTVLYFY